MHIHRCMAMGWVGYGPASVEVDALVHPIQLISFMCFISCGPVLQTAPTSVASPGGRGAAALCRVTALV